MRSRVFLCLVLPLLASARVLLPPTPVQTAVSNERVARRDETPAPTPSKQNFEPKISIPSISIKPVSIPSLSLNLPSNTCTPTIAPDKNGYVPPTECNALYRFYPSFAAAIAFTILFFIVAAAHFVQATIYKTGFVWVILMGTIWQFAGFLSRALSTRDQQSTTLAIVSQLFILLSPLWVNAFDYMVLGRMIHFFLPDRCIGIFKPSLLAKLFVVLDFVAFVIQLVGGGMAGPGQSQDAVKRGINIYMAGIGLQEFFILVFLVLAVQFQRKALSLERAGLLVGLKSKWRPLLYSLYASLLAITVRIIFRLIEFSNGDNPSNQILTHEWYIYAFDAAPMLIAAVIWNIIHPGTILKGPDAKLPPSGVRRFLCSCCGRRKHRDMHKLPGSDPAEELRPFRRESPERTPYR